MAQILKGRKKALLAYNGFIYRRDKARAKTMNWRCMIREGCKGRLITAIDYEEDESPIEKGENCDTMNLQILNI
jgi:hypothetical protein